MRQLEWTLLCCNGHSKAGGETRQHSRVAGVPDKANHAVRRGRKAKGLAHPHLRKPGCRRNGALLWGPALFIEIEPGVWVGGEGTAQRQSVSANEGRYLTVAVVPSIALVRDPEDWLMGIVSMPAVHGGLCFIGGQ